jgi:predicted metal-dependent phosphoesterase TrpH
LHGRVRVAGCYGRGVRRLCVAVCLFGCAGRYPDARRLADELPAIAGLPAEPPQCVVAGHVHTIVSDRYSHAPTSANAAYAYSPAGLRAAIDGFVGVDAMILADHNSTAASFDPMLEEATISVIRGMEWTTRRGHALLFGFRMDGPDDAILPPPWRAKVRRGDFLSMVARTHVRGGLVVVAHPRVPFRTWPDDTFGADGVEVWGFDRWFMRNRQAVRWWHERLRGGERLFALAGTDLHPGAWLRSHRHPLNRVFAGRCDVQELFTAIRRGRTVLVRGTGTARVLVGVEREGAVDFADGGPGDAVLLPATNRIELQVRVIGGSGARVRVLAGAGELYVGTIAGEDQAVRLLVRARVGEFVRVELHRGRKLLALSNPIYLR